MRRAASILAALCALTVASGCGDDGGAKTVTVTAPAVPPLTTPADATTAAPPPFGTTESEPPPAASEAEADGATDPARIEEAARGRLDNGSLRFELVKRIGDFADVGIGARDGGPFEAHAILVYIDAAWTVVYDGNGVVPPDVVAKFGIPSELMGG